MIDKNVKYALEILRLFSTKGKNWATNAAVVLSFPYETSHKARNVARPLGSCILLYLTEYSQEWRVQQKMCSASQ